MPNGRATSATALKFRDYSSEFAFCTTSHFTCVTPQIVRSFTRTRGTGREVGVEEHGVCVRSVGRMLSTAKRNRQAPLNVFFGRLTLLVSEAADLSPEERLCPAVRPGRSAYLDRLHEISSRLSEIDRPAEFPEGP